MGTLVANVYPANITAGLAGHTYVECGTGNRGWGCWGGKKGGQEVVRGTGSTKRANEIAEPNERAGITCYLITGVCHQATNRILLPANILIDRHKVRGYSLSEGLFGPYGKLGSKFFCYAPFEQHSNVTGDLSACVPVSNTDSEASTDEPRRSTQPAERETEYIKEVLDMYASAAAIYRTDDVDIREVEDFHSLLFMHMAKFNLGSLLDDALSKNLGDARDTIEKSRSRQEESFINKEMASEEFVESFNKITIGFQDEMASIMSAEQYMALFHLEPGEHVILADPDIVKTAFDVDDFTKGAVLEE